MKPSVPPDSALCLAGAASVIGTLGLRGSVASDVSLFLLLIFSLMGLETAGEPRTLRLEHGTGEGVALAAEVVSLAEVEFMLRSFG